MTFLRVVATASIVTLSGLCACSKAEKRPPVNAGDKDGTKLHSRDAGHSGSGERDGGTSGSLATDIDGGFFRLTADGGVPGPGDLNEPGAPFARMLSPTDQTEPAEVFDETLTAQCVFEAFDDSDASKIDPSTIIFELADRHGRVLDTEIGERSEKAGIFEATFASQTFPSGPVFVRCIASDSANSPKRGMAQVVTFLDHGPLIDVIAPEEGTAESARGAVAFEYSVEPDELVKGDADAEVVEVKLSLLGEEFELTEREDEPDVYRATVDFTDTELFKEIPSGKVQTVITSTNARGTSSSLTYDFLLDGTGPVVEIQAPNDGDIIGGSVTLRMDVRDSVSNVDWDTLTVNLNDQTYAFDESGAWTRDNTTVYFTFDSADVMGSVVQIHVNVLVNDEAGNESDGDSRIYFRDEQPPIISMDPPNARELDKTVCSQPFDPLGEAVGYASNRVQDIAMYRAFVWDETNSAPGAEILYIAGINQGSVDLFVKRAGSALVTDTTGDGVCDDIVEDGTRFQELTALKRAGSANFDQNGQPDEPPVVGTVIDCTFENRTAPIPLCTDEASDLTVVVTHGTEVNEPVVYAISPNTSRECTGRGWELRSAGLTNYQGWVCMAVRALDRVGNRGISKPMPVCLDNDQVDGMPSCWEDLTEPAPDCTDGCADPPDFGSDGLVIPR